jgi:phage terminase large subunit-like protein
MTLAPDIIRAARKVLARTDPAYFIEYVFGYKLAPHHRQMLEFAYERVKNRENGVILGPRGSAKTTIITTGLSAFLIATRPDIRIGIFSQKSEKAEAMSAAIMSIVSASPAFIELFGNLRGEGKWTATEWVRKGSPYLFSKDRTVVAGGANQSSSIVSKRCDVIILDDVLDENNTSTLEQREKIESWFWRTVKPAQAAEGGSIIVVGTRWAAGDLYEKLIEENHWSNVVIRAIITDPETGEERSYWPEVWPLERLYKERADIGWANFSCAYLNDIVGEGSIIKAEWFKDRFTQLPSDRSYVFNIGIDLASSTRERADWTAGVLVAVDNQHEHWVLHADRIKTETEHRAFVERLWQWGRINGYPVSKIIIESNQHQAVFVQDMIRETSLPVVPRRTDVDKRTRVRAAAARYSMGRIHHHRSLEGGDLEAELLSFPQGHDDLIDALCLALDLWDIGGSFEVIGEAIAPPGEPMRAPDAIMFADGPRTLPEYLAELMVGLPTETMTFEEALAATNKKMLSDYVRAALSREVL